ncbi:MAG: hypothetical protein M1816_000141 [Peltula sp. TS41687]|nr:MAG: hypothetical protein M1816_000141 [Peltula sp. TS41687]
MTAALKAKDTNRLNVLRALLAETTNAAKTSQPITTDLAFLNLLRKRITASQAAADEFAAASREDLKHKEEAQLQVLEEYAKNMDVEVVSREEMELAVDRAVGSMKQEQEETVRAGGERVTVTMGRVVKRLLDEGGELSGKSVDKAMLVHVVDVMLGTGERKKKKKEEKEEEEGKGKSIGDFVKRLSRTLSERELEEISERMEFPPPARYLGDPPR